MQALCRAPQGDGKTELLCTVRGILKKIKQSVLVGDRVRVAGIDWEDMRGAPLPARPLLKAACAPVHPPQSLAMPASEAEGVWYAVPLWAWGSDTYLMAHPCCQHIPHSSSWLHWNAQQLWMRCYHG